MSKLTVGGSIGVSTTSLLAFSVVEADGDPVFAVDTDTSNTRGSSVVVTRSSVLIRDSGSNIGVAIGVDTSGSLRGWINNNSSSRNFELRDNGAVALTLQSGTKNIGIGTTTPTNLLTVGGTFLATGASTFINTATFVGSIGIGTSSPLSRLHIIELEGEGNPAQETGEIARFQRNSVAVANANIVLISGSTGDASVFFGDNASASAGAVQYDNSINALRFKTNGNNTRLTIDSSGNVGIDDTTPTEARLVVGNAGAGDIFFTPTASTTANKALCWDAVGASLILDCGAAPIADYAEAYAVESDVEFGEIVMMTDTMVTQTDGIISPRLARATQGGVLVGITSDNFGDFTSTGHGAFTDNETKIPVALSGRVPVKVNDEGGVIRQGDPVTISSVPGVGKKSENSGDTVVGIALTAVDTTTNTVLVFVTNETNITIADRIRTNLMSVDLGVTDAFSELLTNTTDTIWNRLLNLALGFVDGVLQITGLKTESVITDKLCVGDTCINEVELIELLKGNNTTPALPMTNNDNVPSSDDVAGVSNSGEQEVASPIVEDDSTNVTPDSETPTLEPEVVVEEIAPEVEVVAEPPSEVAETPVEENLPEVPFLETI
jgi:hypothetical protein